MKPVQEKFVDKKRQEYCLCYCSRIAQTAARLPSQAELTAIYYAGGKAFIEFRLMADQKNISFVGLQGAGQLVLGIDIQMVGRLVQQQDIGLAVDQFT